MLKHVTGRAGNVGNDCRILTDKEVVKRAFTNVGLAANDGSDTLADGTACAIGGDKFHGFFLYIIKGGEQLIIGIIAKILVGIVNSRINRAHKANESLSDIAYLLGKATSRTLTRELKLLP